MASSPTPPEVRGAAAQEEAFEAARAQGFLAPASNPEDEPDEEDVQPVGELQDEGGEGYVEPAPDPAGAAMDYANHPAVVGFRGEPDPSAAVRGRATPYSGRREPPPQPKLAAPRST